MNALWALRGDLEVLACVFLSQGARPCCVYGLGRRRLDTKKSPKVRAGTRNASYDLDLRVSSRLQVFFPLLGLGGIRPSRQLGLGLLPLRQLLKGTGRSSPQEADAFAALLCPSCFRGRAVCGLPRVSVRMEGQVSSCASSNKTWASLRTSPCGARRQEGLGRPGSRCRASQQANESSTGFTVVFWVLRGAAAGALAPPGPIVAELGCAVVRM